MFGQGIHLGVQLVYLLELRRVQIWVVILHESSHLGGTGGVVGILGPFVGVVADEGGNADEAPAFEEVVEPVWDERAVDDGKPVEQGDEGVRGRSVGKGERLARVLEGPDVDLTEAGDGRTVGFGEELPVLGFHLGDGALGWPEGVLDYGSGEEVVFFAARVGCEVVCDGGCAG